MSKRSFKDIEEFIKNAAEAHEPAFDEDAWKKMEVLLDKEKDNKKLFAFWWLIPLLIGGAVVSYFVFNKNESKDNQPEIAFQKNVEPAKKNLKITADVSDKNSKQLDKIASNHKEGQLNPGHDNNSNAPISVKAKKTPATHNLPAHRALHEEAVGQTTGEELFAKQQLADKTKGKLRASISSALPATDDESTEQSVTSNSPGHNQNNLNEVKKAEEVLIVKINEGNADEKAIEKIIDSVIESSVTDKKSKNRISKFYVIVTGGAEANGVKLFAADKITGRAGLAAGYQINKNISVQTGFFISNKKYIAGKEDYKTKPGSYWSMVDIKSIDAQCKVYEIPLQVRYDFAPGKKLNLFASAGLSSYIMKKEDYYFYYDRYGAAHQAEVYYKGNKSLLSVLRLSAGVEKKISKNFSVLVSPGIAVPLAGVGEGEVKLFSADLMIGLKFSPARQK